MAETVVLVRCIAPTPRVLELCDEISRALPGCDVIPVPDLIDKDPAAHAEITKQFPRSPLSLTSNFLRSMDLPRDGTRTGWICGDYVLYRALARTWDYAWIVEPDVHFLNGSMSLLRAFESSTTDLIATKYWPASDRWAWHEPLAALFPELRIFAMSFPFFRASRPLVQASLELRQEAGRRSEHGATVPNDESIVATAAASSAFSVQDIEKLLPDVFKYWGTTRKWPIDDIRAAESGPLIVHSALESARFQEYLLNMWEATGESWPVGAEKLTLALERASAETMRQFILAITEKRALRASLD